MRGLRDKVKSNGTKAGVPVPILAARLLSGMVGGLRPTDDWGTIFDIPGLRGISKTRSVFSHNNRQGTLFEAVVDNYIEFFSA